MFDGSFFFNPGICTAWILWLVHPALISSSRKLNDKGHWLVSASLRFKNMAVMYWIELPAPAVVPTGLGSHLTPSAKLLPMRAEAEAKEKTVVLNNPFVMSFPAGYAVGLCRGALRQCMHAAASG